MNVTRITLGIIALYTIVSLGFLLSASNAPVSEVRPPLVDFDEGLPKLTAPAWGVVNLDNGQIIYGTNTDSVLPVASVSKLVTAAVVFGEFSPTTTATVFWTDLAPEGRAGGLYQGQQLTHHQLLFPLLLESSNDAAAVLLRSVGSGELLARMNSYVEEVGMAETTLSDASGLSARNVSTVSNLALLLEALKNDRPHIIDITSLSNYLTPEAGWHNNSPFINDVGYVGGKHGYIEAAGRTAAVIFEERFARGETLEIGYIVLGSEDLLGDVRTLRELVRTRGLGK